MQRKADLSIVDGWKTVERSSDSSWVGELQGRRMPCETRFDESSHTAEVYMRNSLKRSTVDTVLLQAAAEEDTRVKATIIIRGGAVTMSMAHLTGEGAIDQVAENVISNIEPLCTGGQAYDLSQDDIGAYAENRVDELHQEFDKK